jgi:glycosyltransferase involved in cell wall biosynthesis
MDFPREQMEIICVDNASTDATARIVQSYAPALRLVSESKPGPAAARNAGLRAATFPLVAFTDADCTVDRDWLRNLVAPLQNNTADVTGGRILAREQAGVIERFGELVHDHAKAIEYYRPPYLITMNLATSKSLLLAVGGFNERWIRMEDVALSFQFLAHHARMAYVGSAIVRHHNRDSIRTLFREGFLHGYYRPAFLQSHRGFLEQYRQEIAQQAKPIEPKEIPPAARKLKPWQIDLLWKLFNAGKRAGEFVGKRRPPLEQ